MKTTCTCCGQSFEKLTLLIRHMSARHSVDEVLESVDKEEASSAELAIRETQTGYDSYR